MPFGAGIVPTLATAPHSHIRQEADYIRERIDAARALHRKLTSEIRRNESKLEEVREDEFSGRPNTSTPVSITSLKKSIRKRRSRLNRCARNLAAFGDRLAAITLQMQALQQRQWRHSAPQLYGLENACPEHLASAPCRHDWSASTLSNVPQPPTPALIVHPLHVQSQHHPVVGYLPRTPVLRPVHVPRLADTEALQESAGPKHVFDGVEISPTNTVSPYDLNAPRGFPAAQRIDLAEAVSNMRISQIQELDHVPESVVDLSKRLRRLDHESAALRLQKLARKGEELN
ncbi:hypothetical protein A1O7_08408 [Cladophialophora yegresii CBS 114405]|uniref:Uncharacterized protein n=1 Tax=Cladophialophora yegresii CBS 114405 TaxID=1182544 RepID=W9VTJ3_9EURO|nr:uncharacterized protein A1O7_08408 [Cladophialophora yegresii CBS 114405]EXJ55481.1 hypothetical protein A1O7_08408 [Cladophialophora yegresii CBS 114405]